MGKVFSLFRGDTGKRWHLFYVWTLSLDGTLGTPAGILGTMKGATLRKKWTLENDQIKTMTSTRVLNDIIATLIMELATSYLLSWSFLLLIQRELNG